MIMHISFLAEYATMQTQVTHVIRKLECLSPERLAEVDGLIDFLQPRDQEKMCGMILH